MLKYVTYAGVKTKKESKLKQYATVLMDAFERAYDNTEKAIAYAIYKAGRKVENERVFNALEKAGMLMIAVSTVILILLIMFLGV